MGYFYFARHGQTVWNVENKICGATDIELTEKGHEQAKELGEEILKQGIHIDEILYLRWYVRLRLRDMYPRLQEFRREWNQD